jgi:hypothetical protein
LIEAGEERGVAIRRDWKYIVTEREDQLRLTWLLELDPRVLLSRLWRSTPYCLSVLDRQRTLRETADQSNRNDAACRKRLAQQE